MLQKITILIAAILFHSCTPSKNIIGAYNGGYKYWKYKIIFNADSSFVYTLKAHLATDSATGTFTNRKDSLLLFKYDYTKSDSAEAAVYSDVLEISLEHALLNLKTNFRTDTAIIRRKYIIYKDILLTKSKQRN